MTFKNKLKSFCAVLLILLISHTSFAQIGFPDDCVDCGPGDNPAAPINELIGAALVLGAGYGYYKTRKNQKD